MCIHYIDKFLVLQKTNAANGVFYGVFDPSKAFVYIDSSRQVYLIFFRQSLFTPHERKA